MLSSMPPVLAAIRPNFKLGKLKKRIGYECCGFGDADLNLVHGQVARVRGEILGPRAERRKGGMQTANSGEIVDDRRFQF